MPEELHSVPEEVKDFLDFESPGADIVVVLGTQKPEVHRLVSLSGSAKTGEPPAHVDLKPAPVGGRVEVQEADQILAEQPLVVEAGEGVVLLEEVLKDHAEEQIGADVAVVGLGVPSDFQHALQGHEEVFELGQPVLHALDLEQLLQPVAFVHRNVEHELVGAHVDYGYLASAEV